MSYTPAMSLAGYAPLPSAQDGAGETDFIMNFCCHRRFRRASTFESNDAVDELLSKALETHAVALGRIKTLMDRYPLSALKQAYDAFEHDIWSVEPRLFRSIGSTSGVTE